MGKINMGFFYGKLFNSRNRTFSFENGENFIEGTGLGLGTNSNQCICKVFVSFKAVSQGLPAL